MYVKRDNDTIVVNFNTYKLVEEHDDYIIIKHNGTQKKKVKKCIRCVNKEECSESPYCYTETDGFSLEDPLEYDVLTKLSTDNGQLEVIGHDEFDYDYGDISGTYPMSYLECNIDWYGLLIGCYEINKEMYKKYQQIGEI